MNRLILSFYGTLRRQQAWLLLLIAIVLAGCGHDNVQVYRLSNDDSSSSSPPPNTTAAAPAPNENNAARPQLHWTLPSGWTEVAPGAMSIATFKLSGQNGAEAEESKKCRRDEAPKACSQ